MSKSIAADRERANDLIAVLMVRPKYLGRAITVRVAQALADERARAAAIVRALAGGTGQITYSWSKEQSERIAAAIEHDRRPPARIPRPQLPAGFGVDVDDNELEFGDCDMSESGGDHAMSGRAATDLVLIKTLIQALNDEYARGVADERARVMSRVELHFAGDPMSVQSIRDAIWRGETP